MCWQRHDDSSLMENVDLIVDIRHENHMMHVLLLYPHVVLAAGACRAGATRRDVRPFAVVWPGLDVTCESLAQSRRVGRGDEWRRQLTRAVRLDRLDVAG